MAGQLTDYMTESKLHKHLQSATDLLVPVPQNYGISFQVISGSWECGNLQTTIENTSVQRCIYQIILRIPTYIH